ncbi:MAG: hypothetical protein GDA41_06785 [Rhodospirillales bacterium]|nr:hypothetical protein [Rhodospirillales bacterium]
MSNDEQEGSVAMTGKPSERNIPVERLVLDLENPRHGELDTEQEAIEFLCSNEDVIPLVRDIARYGLNPIDRLAVVIDNGDDGPEGNFVVAEGNRRLCAIKLLTGPALAPSQHRDAVEKAAADWTPITEISCVVFDDKTAARLWLARRHQGSLGGVGFKPWNAEQKARHSDVSSRNRVAQAFLDWAEKKGLITPEDRLGRLTTVQRYLSNSTMRQAMGIDASDPNDVRRTRPGGDMNLLAQRFIGDLLSGEVTSRHKKADIERYAGKLDSLPGLSYKRVDPQLLAKKPRNLRKISRHPEIDQKLQELNDQKLCSLYNSITTISAKAHMPLIAVGVWAFFETLTALLGRDPKTSFSSFLNKQYLEKQGLDAGDNRAMREAIGRIHAYGNTTKHHYTLAAFNAEQLEDDMTTLSGLIAKLIERAPRDS